LLYVLPESLFEISVLLLLLLLLTLSVLPLTLVAELWLLAEGLLAPVALDEFVFVRVLPSTCTAVLSPPEVEAAWVPLPETVLFLVASKETS